MSDYRIRAHEGGSLATFVVVGFVLAVLVVGGVYTVQKKSQQTASRPITSPSVSKSPSRSHPVLPQKPKASSPVAVKPSSAPTAKVPNGRLPATGPSSDFMSMLMLAGLVGMVTAYVRSRNTSQFVYQVD